jgi:ferredoxin-NADP reductase
MARAAVRGRLTWRVADVVSAAMETAAVRTLVLDVAGWPGHRAGQHVDLRLTAEDGYQAQRSYSIASAPDDARLALTVERLDDGEVSPYLVDEVRPGDRIELRGPIGGYFVWDATDGDTRPLMLIAGGSGIVPLMAMLRHRAAVASAAPARLLASWRSLDNAIYAEDLGRLAAAGDGLEITTTLTRAAPPGWTGEVGRITPDMLARFAWPAERRPLAFVCGPTGFVEAVAEALVGLGHDPASVRTERFGPTGGTDG